MALNIRDVDIDLPGYIDHAVLDPCATSEDLSEACAIADRYRFATVCCYPAHVRLAVERLGSSKTKVCTVIGFPTGATTSAVKLYEAQEAVENGASELDVVINLGWLKEGKGKEVNSELAAIVEATNRPIKAILETRRLNPDELRFAAEVALDAGVMFLKTSTGWSGGATVEDIQALRDITRGGVRLKASGGISTLEQAFELILAGADRLGTSRGPELMAQLKAR
jgi:deoxyribose-phosphate aldolase